MTAPMLDRDHAGVDALVADRYLDALLAAGDRRAADVPVDASLDPELRAAVRALRRSLVRVHPSFRFEERLAARLADLAAVQASPHGVGAAMMARVVPFGRRTAGGGADDPQLAAILAGDLDPAAAVRPDDSPIAAPAALAALAASAAPTTLGLLDRRPWLVGGAVTSAAISLAGVAFVAWRASRAARSAANGLGPGALATAALGAGALLSGEAGGSA